MAKKLSNQWSKRRRLEGSSAAVRPPDVEAPVMDPIPMRLPKPKKSGKVNRSLNNLERDKLTIVSVST